MMRTRQKPTKVASCSQNENKPISFIVSSSMRKEKEKLKDELSAIPFTEIADRMRSSDDLLVRVVSKIGFKVIMEIADEKYQLFSSSNQPKIYEQQRYGFIRILELYKIMDQKSTRLAFRGLRLFLFKNKLSNIFRDIHMDYFRVLICPICVGLEKEECSYTYFKAKSEGLDLSKLNLFAGTREDFCTFFESLN